VVVILKTEKTERGLYWKDMIGKTTCNCRNRDGREEKLSGKGDGYKQVGYQKVMSKKQIINSGTRHKSLDQRKCTTDKLHRLQSRKHRCL